MKRWFNQWVYGTTVSGIAGGVLPVFYPIAWWRDGYTTSISAILFVAAIGAAWATADYAWQQRRIKP